MSDYSMDGPGLVLIYPFSSFRDHFNHKFIEYFILYTINTLSTSHPWQQNHGGVWYRDMCGSGFS